MSQRTSTFKRIAPIFLMIFATIAIPLQILDEHGLPRFQALQKEKNKLVQKNEKIQTEISSLKIEIKNLTHRSKYIEKIARDELGLIREGEIVFQFSE